MHVCIHDLLGSPANIWVGCIEALVQGFSFLILMILTVTPGVLKVAGTAAPAAAPPALPAPAAVPPPPAPALLPAGPLLVPVLVRWTVVVLPAGP